jgi:ElaB/YqjD/DUF883 family membrane-anchored ribosome-binding protein
MPLPNRTGSTTERLVADFKTVIAEAEDVIKAAADKTGDQFAVSKQRLENTLSRVRNELEAIEASAMERAKVVARATTDYVQDNPWKAAGATFAVGLVGMAIGLLMTRR